MNTQETLKRLQNANLSSEERAVMNVLMTTYWPDGNVERVTQKNIANSEPYLRCHGAFESGVVQDPDSTTLRHVRQIVRDLRVDHGAPILSDTKGYWIPRKKKEAVEYLERIEKQARSSARSYFETYEAMQYALGVTSQYFEKQRDLFEGETESMFSQ